MCIHALTSNQQPGVFCGSSAPHIGHCPLFLLPPALRCRCCARPAAEPPLVARLTCQTPQCHNTTQYTTLIRFPSPRVLALSFPTRPPHCRSLLACLHACMPAWPGSLRSRGVHRSAAPQLLLLAAVQPPDLLSPLAGIEHSPFCCSTPAQVFHLISFCIRAQPCQAATMPCLLSPLFLSLFLL